VRWSSSRRTVTSYRRACEASQVTPHSTRKTPGAPPKVAKTEGSYRTRTRNPPPNIAAASRFRRPNRPVTFSPHGTPRRSIRSGANQWRQRLRRLHHRTCARLHRDRHVRPQADLPAPDRRHLARKGVWRSGAAGGGTVGRWTGGPVGRNGNSAERFYGGTAWSRFLFRP
jgi:hypothetical protein